jgi:hypothetical protein
MQTADTQWAKWYPFRGCAKNAYMSSSDLGTRKVRNYCLRIPVKRYFFDK